MRFGHVIDCVRCTGKNKLAVAVLALSACSGTASRSNISDAATSSSPTRSAAAGSGDAGGTAVAPSTPTIIAGAAAGNAGRSTPVAGMLAVSGHGGANVEARGSAGSNSAQTAAGSGASAAAGSGAPAGCTRELLRTTIDSYLAALAAHDPMRLPLADGVKFTENGEVLQLGEGLWRSAGMAKYAHSALDTDTCTTVSEAVVPDGSRDIPLGLRLKVEAGKLTEIETIAVRPGDYKVFGSDFPSNTNAIIASRERVKWEEPVPLEQRDTREQITGWLERYFKTFPRGGCNLADDCQRLENGGGSFECSAALSCDMAAPLTGAGALRPRVLVADVETGIGVGFTMFMGNTDFHMIKMYGGEIHAVHAILGAADSSGWD